MNSSSVSSLRQLAARVLGLEAGQRFDFAWIPLEEGRDVFEIEGGGERVFIRGSSAPAMGMGLNWYLKHYAGVHVSWRGAYTSLPRSLPSVCGTVRHVCWARWRYFLNYCCFSYSMLYWSWTEWEPLIDWMALNGINMPLAVTGQEAVWQRVCRRLDLDENQINDFLPGPAYMPFGWMGCLDGWGARLPDDWISRHEELGQAILRRERELGMTPVLQGFTGHIPAALAERHREAQVHHIHWLEWDTCLLDPMDPLFAWVAAVYLDEQTRLFGTDHYYAADTFIEMTPPSGEPDYLANLGRAIYSGMSKSDTDAVWVLQGWPFWHQRKFWAQNRVAAFLNAVPNDRMLLLDLHCENMPMWDKFDAFCGKPWLWCNVQNFGCNVSLNASLEINNSGLFEMKADPRKGELSGIGIVNEGLCYNPVAYDFFFEQAWRETKVDLVAWGRGYSRHRYGSVHSAAERAWEILVQTVYHQCKDPDCYRIGHSELLLPPAEPARKGRHYWTKELIEVWGLLLSIADDLADRETYRFDLVNVGRQVISNLGGVLKTRIHEAAVARDLSQFDKLADQIRTIITDLDLLLATRRDFLLGNWISQAKSWGADEAEQSQLEWEARRQVTLWGNGNPGLRDYAQKEWSGLLSSYYLPRWEHYFDAVHAAIQQGREFIRESFESQLLEWERSWPENREVYPSEERGDAVAISRKLYARYAGAKFLQQVTAHKIESI